MRDRQSGAGVEDLVRVGSRPSVEGVRVDDVFIVQSTGPPVNDNLVELLLLIDACRRGAPDV